MIQTETTPNPNSLKFLSEKTISSIGTEEFQRDNSKNVKNIFVKELLELKGGRISFIVKKFYFCKKNRGRFLE